MVPEGPLALTAGVDVQNDRLEIEVVEWAPGCQSWSIICHILYGDTSDIDDPVWGDLEQVQAKLEPIQRDEPRQPTTVGRRRKSRRGFIHGAIAMASTQTQLAELDKAIAEGVLTVSYDGRAVTCRSLQEMKTVRATI